MYCSTCNVESGPTLFCHVCDNYLPNPLTGIKAGLVRRFFAVILDDVIALLVLGLSIRTLVAGPTQSEGNSGFVLVILSCVALFMYAIAFFGTLSVGLTPGKWISQIRVVDKRNGQIPGLGRMLVRETIGKFVSGFFLGLGFFWAIWDRDSQAWHDKLAGTVVIRQYAASPSQKPSNTWPATACLALLACFVLQFFSATDVNRVPPYRQNTTFAPTNAEAVQQPYSESSPQASASNTLSDAGSPANQSEEPIVTSIDTSSTSESAVTAIDQAPLSKLQVTETLTKWATATESNDAQAVSSFYADPVVRYFLARNVTRAEILSDKQKWLDEGHRTVSFQLENLNFDEVSPKAASLSVVKSVEVSSPGMASIERKIRSRLWLENFDGEWKITGEQDLKD